MATKRSEFAIFKRANASVNTIPKAATVQNAVQTIMETRRMADNVIFSVSLVECLKISAFKASARINRKRIILDRKSENACGL